MSQENVERLREAYELLNSRFPELKAGDLGPLLDYFDPEVVIEMVDVPDPATYKGHEGVRLRGEVSGVPVELATTAVHQFRNGRIVRDRIYLNRAEALEAVGLLE